MAHALRAEAEFPADYFTYGDYLEWETSDRYEIIDGEAFMMSAPSTEHQRISMRLSLQFGNFLRGKPCEVFAAPFDVRLLPKPDLSDDTVVQPDLVVVCDKSKLSKRGCDGPPDLAIEIASPSDNHRLSFLKFQKYLRSGVREYWIISPEEKAVQAHRLKDANYLSTVYANDEAIPVSVLPGLTIGLKTLWEAA
jgi:Uma2 family endonuclease